MTDECGGRKPILSTRDMDRQIRGIVLCFEVKQSETGEKLEPVNALPIHDGLKFVNAALAAVKACSQLVRPVKAIGSLLRRGLTLFQR